MKKIFLSAFALFVVSAIGFFTSGAILGKRYNVNYHSYDEASYEARVFSGDYSASDSWTVLNRFPYVNINSAGVKTVIGRSGTDRITINLVNPSNKTVHVEAVYTGDQLTIEARPTNITFDLGDIQFGITNWLEDIFSGNSDVTVMIGFPEAIYDEVNIQQGSGTMQINDLYSRRYDVKIGSGKCEFNRSSSGGFISDRFELELGSGNALFSGMESEYYDINIGSGKFNLSKLSGNGYINMGSGSGEICFTNDDGEGTEHEIDMGSGNLTLYFPSEGGFTLSECEIGSGKVDINAYGAEKKLGRADSDEFGEITLGTGESKLEIEMGSGYIGLRDSSAYTSPEIISEFKIIDAAVIDDGTESAVQITDIITSSDDSMFASGSSVEETPIVVVGGENTSLFEIPSAPEAPEVPEAPEPPEAPSAPEVI